MVSFLWPGTVISIHPKVNLAFTAPIVFRLRQPDTVLRKSPDPSILVHGLLDLSTQNRSLFVLLQKKLTWIFFSCWQSASSGRCIPYQDLQIWTGHFNPAKSQNHATLYVIYLYFKNYGADQQREQCISCLAILYYTSVLLNPSRLCFMD